MIRAHLVQIQPRHLSYEICSNGPVSLGRLRSARSVSTLRIRPMFHLAGTRCLGVSVTGDQPDLSTKSTTESLYLVTVSNCHFRALPVIKTSDVSGTIQSNGDITNRPPVKDSPRSTQCVYGAWWRMELHQLTIKTSK